MYGIVQIAGHQYRVEVGDVIDVQKFDQQEVGSQVELDQLLFIGGEKVQVGLPTVPGGKVKAEVVRQGRSRKVTVFKRSPGNYQKKKGHRQPYTSLKILEIVTSGGKG